MIREVLAEPVSVDDDGTPITKARKIADLVVNVALGGNLDAVQLILDRTEHKAPTLTELRLGLDSRSDTETLDQVRSEVLVLMRDREAMAALDVLGDRLAALQNVRGQPILDVGDDGQVVGTDNSDDQSRLGIEGTTPTTTDDGNKPSAPDPQT